MATYITKNLNETIDLGRRLGQQLKGGELIAFTGNLGSGKTTFCHGLAQGLGSLDPVQSPTFAVANLYRGTIPFAHFDAYRIASEDDLEMAGFYDYLDQGAVVAVEWSENVASLLPPPYIKVAISSCGENCREFEIEGAPNL